MSRKASAIYFGCRDCDMQVRFSTLTEVEDAAMDHELETGHRPMVADNNGWHMLYYRAWKTIGG